MSQPIGHIGRIMEYENVVKLWSHDERTLSANTEEFVDYVNDKIKGVGLSLGEVKELEHLKQLIVVLKESAKVESDLNYLEQVETLVQEVLFTAPKLDEVKQKDFEVKGPGWKQVVYKAETILNELAWKIAGKIKSRVYQTHAAKRSYKDSIVRETEAKRELDQVKNTLEAHYKNEIADAKAIVENEFSTRWSFGVSERDERTLEILKEACGERHQCVELYERQIRLQRVFDELQEYNDLERKAAQFRSICTTLGGENVKLSSVDGNKLDATYVSGKSFREKIEKAGGQHIVFDHDPNSRGIVINDDAKGRELLNLLMQVGAVESPSRKGSGLKAVAHEGKILLLREEVIKENEWDFDLKWIPKQNVYVSSGGLSNQSYKMTPIDEAKGSGTVIVFSGSSGVYEMHKKELVQHLLSGMNVMLANVRGSGQSEGVPFASGIHRDTETIYQYVKAQGTPDEKIVVSGMCLSGGFVAHLAKRHPNINVILDQTYSEFNEVLMNQVKKMYEFELKEEDSQLKKRVKEIVNHSLSTVVKHAVKLAFPNFSVRQNISHIKGNVLVLTFEDDTLTHPEKIENMLHTHRPQGSLHYRKIPGKHGSGWVNTVKDDQYIGRLIMSEFLKASGLYNPLL